MSKAIIGIGKCSKYYLFILGTIICKVMRTFIFANEINPKSEGGIFGFTPILNDHLIIQYFYKYISFIIGGLISEYILRKKKNENEDINYHYHHQLIENDEYKSSKQKKCEILIVCFAYCIAFELNEIFYYFDFGVIDLWTFDILFVLYFMRKYFIINIYNFQKIAIIIIAVLATSLLILSSFLPYTEHDTPEEKSEDKNGYEIIEKILGSKLYSIPIIPSLLFINMCVSYSRAKSKVLMDLRYISPYLIMLYIGICGFIVFLIILIISPFLKCGKNLIDYCIVKESDESEEIYFENPIIYFNHMKNFEYKIYIEIFVIIPLFLIINFFEFLFQYLIIYHFNPNFILIRDNIYYFTKRLLLVLVNIDSFNNYISLPQFIILELSELISIIAFCIYLEIIELRFCGLNRNLKRNISIRAISENFILMEDKQDSKDDPKNNNYIVNGNDNESEIYLGNEYFFSKNTF